MNTLLEHGFIKLLDLSIGESGRIDRTQTKSSDLCYLIYAFVINDDIVYIGQTKNLFKRMDSYCNGKYWKNTNKSHIKKSSMLEDAIKAGHKVSLYIRHCHKLVFTNPSGSNVLSSMDQDESKYIKMFNPPWNIKLKERRNEKKRNNSVQSSDEVMC